MSTAIIKSNTDNEGKYSIYKAYLNKWVIAKSIDEVKSIILDRDSHDSAAIQITEFSSVKEICESNLADSIHVNPELAILLPKLGIHWDNFLNYAEESLFDTVSNLNTNYNYVSRVLSYPTTFPVIPQLEISCSDALIFCYNVANGKPVDGNQKGYLSLRYPDLFKLIIQIREENEENDMTAQPSE